LVSACTLSRDEGETHKRVYGVMDSRSVCSREARGRLRKEPAQSLRRGGPFRKHQGSGLR
jgi:hypothetical protein